LKLWTPGGQGLVKAFGLTHLWVAEENYPMTRIALLFSIALIAFPLSADMPKEGTFGAGAEIGTVGAITAKYFIIDRGAIDAGIEFLDKPFSVIYSDFLWHIPGLFPRAHKFWRESALYFGGGGGVGFWDRLDSCGRWNCHWNSNSQGAGNGFFIRAVGGIEWYPSKTHWGVYGEVAPSYIWYPGGASMIDVAVGGRFYF
jgi:hypothetical protein